LVIWQTESTQELDELEAAHSAVGGSGRGRRYATEQINHAYLVMLAAQFQLFCRGLHDETTSHVCATTKPAHLQDVLRTLLSQGRKLDRGNAYPGGIGSDFGRFGISFWDRVLALDRRNRRRQAKLELLNHWRNAIGHQDFNKPELGGRNTITLPDVRRFRKACDGLTVAFDEVMRLYLEQDVGSSSG